MKKLIVGFDQFVNEMYEYEPAEPVVAKTSECCGAPVLEDGTCEACGNLTEVEEVEPISDETEEFAPEPDKFELDNGDPEQVDPEDYKFGMNEAKKKAEAAKGKFPNLKPNKPAPAGKPGVKGVNPFAKPDAKTAAKPAGKPGVKGVNQFSKPEDKKDLMKKDPKKMGVTDDKGKPFDKKDDPKSK
jgi:hypothetical protein